MNTWFRSPVNLFIFIVVFAAMVAVVWVALTHFGIVVPAFVVQIFWICVAAFIVVAALSFLASLAGGWWRNNPPGPPNP